MKNKYRTAATWTQSYTYQTQHREAKLHSEVSGSHEVIVMHMFMETNPSPCPAFSSETV